MFVETSAKVGHNVKALFKRIAQALPGMEGEGQQGVANSKLIDVAWMGKWMLTCRLAIDVNVNQQKPESEGGCNC
jgi:Ras-related protein Rab-6A